MKKSNKKNETTPVIESALVIDSFNRMSEIKKSINDVQLLFLKNTLYPTLSHPEILMVMYQAYNLKLDVFNGELTAYKNSKGQLVMIVGKDAKNRRASQTGKIEYFRSEAIYTQKRLVKTGDKVLDKDGIALDVVEDRIVRVEPWEGGTLWGAVATLKRSDMETPFVVTLPLSEYRQQYGVWTDKPETMIKKTATSQVLTLAFPELFAGIYEEEELPGQMTKVGQVESVDDGTPATSAQIETIKNMGGQIPDEGYTLVQAGKAIKNLINK